jgi:hypothetical protein
MSPVRLCQTPPVQSERQTTFSQAPTAGDSGSRSPLAAVPPTAMPQHQGWQWRVLFERRDLWVGVFWDRKPDGLHVFVCPVPTVAVHVHRKA